MANDIKGITVEIGGDTTNLKKALEDVNKSAAATTKELTQINRQLKYDPSNTTLLAQKHERSKTRKISWTRSNSRRSSSTRRRSRQTKAPNSGELFSGKSRRPRASLRT